MEEIELPRRTAVVDAVSGFTGLFPPFKQIPRGSVAIGAGKVGAVAAAWLKRRTGMRAICIMRPPFAGLQFDRVVVPEHDLYLRPNTIQTIGGLHGWTRAHITEAAKALTKTSPLAAVLIGGPSGTARFDRAGEARLFADLQTLQDRGYHLYATASRRTPAPVLGRLQDRFPDAVLHKGNGPNPYPGLLGAADVFVVTSDSVSMVSEALFTGKPVIVSGSEQDAPKLRRFLEQVAPRLSTVEGAFTPYTPLDEAKRVADALIEDGLLS
jgi:mitochondrial fission protein ELM1